MSGIAFLHLQCEQLIVVEEQMREYISHSKTAASVDYSDKASVARRNSSCDRMRAIVDEVAMLGKTAVLEFSSLLDHESAGLWIAHHLVKKAELDRALLLRCFTRVERAVLDAKAEGDAATARGEEMWLAEWREKKL